MNLYINEACQNPLFCQLWAKADDALFRPYAWAAMTFAQVDDLAPNARHALYRAIATEQRASLLDRLSGRDVWKTRLGLVSRADYRAFDEADWLTLFDVAADPQTRRALGHLEVICPPLLRQLSAVPAAIRLPALLAVLNRLDVSAGRWQQLAAALAEAPPQILPSLLAKARKVNSIGSFWDYFFACVARPWRPFDFPERFHVSPMLRPLRTMRELDREGLRMEKCLASQAVDILSGRHAYFRWQGDQPATVQFTRRSGWHLGRVLGVRNQPVPYDLLEEIRRSAEPLLAGVGDDVEEAEDGSATTIDALCERARRTFSVAESEPLAEALRRIQGKTLGHGADTNAYCIFATHLGFVQFLASVDGHEYLCEIQSHRYHAAVEEKLTDAAVTRPQPGRHRSEQVVAINRNRWSRSIGTGGRNQPECAHNRPPCTVLPPATASRAVRTTVPDRRRHCYRPHSTD